MFLIYTYAVEMTICFKMSLAACAGSAALTIGRPTTRKSLPAAVASAGVATLF